MTFHATITQAIRASPLAPLAIAKAARIAPPHVYRYISTGAGLSVDSLERLATTLGLSLRDCPPKTTTAKGKK